MSIRSLVETGSIVWLDSVDPIEVARNLDWGVTGATSNPSIVADVVKTGQLDGAIRQLLGRGLDEETIAWELTDQLVTRAQEAFLSRWEQTGGDDGFASFELDPLLEDPAAAIPLAERTRQYIELGRRWAQGQRNRMIKVPATPAGLAALEDLAAAGVNLNVTLIFTARQYLLARDAVWRGAQRRPDGLDRFKSVYSIFISRLDVYTAKHVPDLSPAAQGMAGIVNARRLWAENQRFWADKGLRLRQQIVFASTGVKTRGEPPDKYLEALAGSDILTNPPATNAAVQASGKRYQRTIDRLPPPAVLDEIDRRVDQAKMEQVLIEEGVAKFAEPHKALMELIGQRRR